MKPNKRHTYMYTYTEEKKRDERRATREEKCNEQDFSLSFFFVFAKEYNRTIFCMNAKENDCKREREKERKKWRHEEKETNKRMREPPCPLQGVSIIHWTRHGTQSVRSLIDENRSSKSIPFFFNTFFSKRIDHRY